MIWETCPGCGLRLASDDGARAAIDPRRNASAGCWMVRGEVTARELGDLPRLGRYHQLTVDAYSAQHAGPGTSALGTAFALIGLHLALDHGLDGLAIRDAHQRLAAAKVPWPRFGPPAARWPLTVEDVARAPTSEEHAELVQRWAASVWAGWHDSQATIEQLVTERLPELGR
jgi:hypothetical protein